MMALYYEDVEIGTQVPPLIKRPTTRQLVMWAGASRDLTEQHYDKDNAMARGLSGVIVHGALKASWLSQLMTDWIGADGQIKELKCRYMMLDYPGTEIVCHGKVTKKYLEGNEHLIDCEVWTENSKRDLTTTGVVTVSLPSRST